MQKGGFCILLVRLKGGGVGKILDFPDISTPLIINERFLRIQERTLNALKGTGRRILIKIH